MKTPYIVGPPVKQPADFFGRAYQTRQFFNYLAGAQLQCVSVLGLRRAGKTSFLQHVSHPEVMAAYLSHPERYLLLYVDLSACQTSCDFYTRVYNRLLNALPRAAGGTTRAKTADVYMVESLLYEFGGRRVVVLMDEFDQLRTADFGDDFMTELRALAGVWEYELAYVTASYWDLYRLGKFVGLPLTSPFYNIFYPTPIYLSGLGPSELDDLVRVPAGRVGIVADDEDVAYVRHIAGTLPFFVQAMATVWLTHKSKDRTPDTREVTLRLVSEMGPYYEQWMRNFNDVERDILAAVAQERKLERLPYDEVEIQEAVNRLRKYGVLTITGDHLWSDSRLFNHWLKEYFGRNKNPDSTKLSVSSYQIEGHQIAGTAISLDGSRGEQCVEAIDEAGKQIERNLSAYPQRSDEVLRDVILASMRSVPATLPQNGTLTATGNTDILARIDGANIFVAECRSWQGQKAFLQTADHLLSYLTYGDTSAAAVIFVRNQALSLIINAIVQAMPHHPGYLGFRGYRSGSRLDYQFHINGDPQSEVNLSVLLFHLPD